MAVIELLLLGLSAQAQQKPQPPPLRSEITVTAVRGASGEAETSTSAVATADRLDFAVRPIPTLGNALDGAPGILVQQSTVGQVSPFLRGLTGYQVLNLIDGLRLNNSTFRSGPNQYLAFVDPSQAARVEAVMGPTGAQYGSDAMGGTIQVLTPDSRYTDGPLETHGEFSLWGGSADTSVGGVGQLSIGTRRLSWLAGGTMRSFGDLRPGGGADSRQVLRRLFGLSDSQVRGMLGSRMVGTGFDQFGLHTKLAARVRDDQLLTLWYQRSGLGSVQGYKDLWGGLGRMESLFDPQGMDFAYARYEKLKLGWLDSLSGTFSVNEQRDGSLRQNLRATDAVTVDDSTVRALGYVAQGSGRLPGRQTLVFGADVYDERVGSFRQIRQSVARPLYPDGSRYRTYGWFAQDAVELVPGKLRALLAGRLTRIGFRTFAAKNPGLGVADSSDTFHNFTYQTSLSWQVTRIVGLHVLAGRGFRAPNLNDLGALGLNDLGYEIPASEAAGALMGLSAGENALPGGRTVSSLSPERLRNYELGLTLRNDRLYTRIQGFHADLYDPIVRRTLLFPASAVPAALAGLEVRPIAQTAAQQALGVITVATAFDPRAVKAFVNDGRSRYYGLEWQARYAFNSHWRAFANYSYIAGRDLFPNRNIRRLPPQQGMLSLRYDRKWWLETRVLAAGAQQRLSGGDLDDERIGASRRRQDIADFFAGSRIAPYISGGRFTPTGETLTEIQNRVLPGVDNSTRVPLYTSTAGWMMMEVRGGVPLGERLQLTVGVSNLLDRNYRTHGSGVDAPGAGVYANLQYRF
ncbi:MAG: TonB-dependent receptor [Bryobacteraceae bacterium]|nr:TonB-dependent receptor [Bryobacteraceae bacterium]